jgi:putative aldouronate transport system permease protein
MYGIQIAFKNYNSFDGINGSPWVACSSSAGSSRHTTASTSSAIPFPQLYLLVATFPLPILLALVLNYATLDKLKKVTQTVTYAPHFISTVVMVGMILVFFSSNGVVTSSSSSRACPRRIFSARPAPSATCMCGPDVWQHTGWNCIIYIAALAGVNPSCTRPP